MGTENATTSSQDIERFKVNLHDEIDGAALYAALAAAEKDPVRKDLFLQLAEAESRHAEFWRKKLAAHGIQDIKHVPSLRTRVLARLARRFGPGFVLPSIAEAEFADRDKYSRQSDAHALSAEERGHAAVVNAALQGDRPSASIGADIATAEPWHRGASGNSLRAAVLGANDGLVSNFCLIMGVAGAGVGSKVILLTGLAGLLAGASSMALGEWLSVTNSRELARTQIARERMELEQTPDSEQKELALIYQAKGLSREEAQKVAAELMQDKQAALDTLAREELGIDPTQLGGNPWTAAGASFALFVVGAVFPVMPFLFGTHGVFSIELCIGLSILALAGIGMATSLFNGRSAWFSAGRQVIIGSVAAAVTYGVGALIGVSLS
ncbi:MAG TPA: VIT1/CCC1 transporter family protein [Gammaproteobacteria bacterium]|nr:VIT1/CCC1 transporter family protein [Gammaproteobacteria bacterium]